VTLPTNVSRLDDARLSLRLSWRLRLCRKLRRLSTLAISARSVLAPDTFSAKAGSVQLSILRGQALHAIKLCFA